MIASTEQYAAMLDSASAGGYALPAVNVTSSETLNGAMRGLRRGGRRRDHPGHDRRGRVPVGRGGQRHGHSARERSPSTPGRLADRYPVLIALHTDHAPPDKFDAFVRPLIDESRRRRAAGRGAAVSLAHVRRLDAAAGGQPAVLGAAARRARAARRRARGRERRGRRRGGRHRRPAGRPQRALHHAPRT